VVRLLIGGNSACTGWLVGSAGHVFTNEHCLTSQADVNSTDFEFMGEGSTCNTNCDSWLGCPGTVWGGAGTYIQDDATLDYCLVQLAGNPQSTYGYLQLRQSSPVLNEQIYIPQHPNAWGKKIAFDSDYSQDGGKCKVNALNYNNCYTYDIGYYCDTAGGSSGSPVLATSDNFVIALHHCGTCMNSATPIDDIIPDLGANLPPNAVPGGGCTAPGAPTLNSATAGCSQVVLSWSAGSGTTNSYNVYRKTQSTCTGGTYTKIAGPITSTTYTDTSVTAGTTYAYMVRGACDTGGVTESSDSNCLNLNTHYNPCCTICTNSYR